LDRAASGVFAETTATTSGVQNAKMETDPIADRAKEQALFNFLNETPLGATDPQRRAMLKKCSEQIQRILAASIKAERREKDFRRKDRHSQTGSEGRAEPRLELEPKQKLKL
jgi:hypothetical protein